MSIREIIKRMRHDGCGGLADKAGLLRLLLYRLDGSGTCQADPRNCALSLTIGPSGRSTSTSPSNWVFSIRFLLLPARGCGR
jgi:hypothetical protein